MPKLQSSFILIKQNIYHTGPDRSRKAKITASMCTNKIRALAVDAVDKVNWTVIPKNKNTG